jgi:signal transduction histidine kinase
MAVENSTGKKIYSAHLLCLAVAITGHFITYLQYRSGSIFIIFPNIWTNQFTALLIVSMLLSASLLLPLKDIMKELIFITQGIVFFIIGYPEGENLWIELTLIFVLILQSIVHFPLILGIINSSLLLLLFLIVQKPLLAWDIRINSAPLSDIIAFEFCGWLFLSVLVIWKLIHRQNKKTKKDADYLQEAVLNLTSANLKFQDFAVFAKDQSALDERNRITREIHDSLGYLLTNIAMMIQAAQHLTEKDPELLRCILKKAHKQTQDGITETRRTLRTFRSIDQETSAGIRTISGLVNNFKDATNVIVQVEYGNLPWTLGNEIDLILYRMVQEGLANAFRHGKASKVLILMWFSGGAIEVRIQDNGTGMTGNAIQEGIGFEGMRERISALGGNISARNISPGFELYARIPISGQDLYQ